MVVLYTLEPKYFCTCSTTCTVRLYRSENMVNTTPSISRYGLYFLRMVFRVLMSSDKTLQRIILTLHRNEHAVAGTQAVQGEQIQAGRAIDKDEVIVLLHLGQRLAQTALTAGQVDHFRLAPARRVLEPMTSVRYSVLRMASDAVPSPIRIS